MMGGVVQLVAEWDRAGPGLYDIAVRGGSRLLTHRLRVEPTKITSAAFSEMLVDLEARLPVTLAIALRDAGARIAVEFAPPEQQTIATEVARLRRAVLGGSRLGLAAVLEQLATDPHRMLHGVDVWVKRQDVRRPHPTGLVQVLWKAGNMARGAPMMVLDRRVEHTVDLYENRLVKAFANEVEQRLRLLHGELFEMTQADLLDEVSDLLERMMRARRTAAFLHAVGPMRSAPGRVTMVLLKRREYRAAFEGFLEFRRRPSVHLDEPALLEPLRNLPHLYQVWGTLVAMTAAVKAAHSAGFVVKRHQLVWPHAGGTYVSVLRNGKAAVEMQRGSDVLRLIPERSYAPGAEPLGSVSFSQIPDLAIELTRGDGQREVVLLDPKYKLDSEDTAEGDGRPKKTDIDKMHAYRDAIRDRQGGHPVRMAAILYPGSTRWFGSDVVALRAYPGEATLLEAEVTSMMEDWLSNG
jgi:hypothetical protein